VKTRHLVAIGLLGLMAFWMFFPRSQVAVDDRYRIPAGNQLVHALSEGSTPPEAGIFAVRVIPSMAQAHTATVRVRGRTQAFRHVNVRSEASGQVVSTPFPRGARVSRGDILCELALDNREVELQEAVSREQQARMEYEAELDLERRGLQARVTIAQRKTALDAATAAVARARLNLERTRIRAPFDGIVEQREIEVGDYLDMGAVCASVLDDQPMLMIGQVAEHEVGRISEGAPVEGHLVTGEIVSGQVIFISRAADPTTRSYRLEIELAPSGKAIRQGVTAEILVATEEIMAHIIPPSSLTLDDEGIPGVKVVDAENRVQFYRVNIIGERLALDDSSGFWVTGLPAQVNLITVGQELVFPGQIVRSDFSWTNSN
jgi:multidrug efflux system membrane fusion protein